MKMHRAATFSELFFLFLISPKHIKSKSSGFSAFCHRISIVYISLKYLLEHLQ
jgi:hypothetical protein